MSELPQDNVFELPVPLDGSVTPRIAELKRKVLDQLIHKALTEGQSSGEGLEIEVRLTNEGEEL